MKPFEENDETIEAALERLKPTRPDAELMQRLVVARPRTHDDKSSRQRTPVSGQNFWRLFVPVMGAIALVFLLKNRPPETEQQQAGPQFPTLASTSQVFEPVETNSFVIDSEELALLPGPDSRPVRLMRVRWVDYARSRADDGSELLLATERENVFPVSFQLY